MQTRAILIVAAAWMVGCAEPIETGTQEQAVTTVTFHLHGESSPSIGLYILKTNAPEAALVTKQFTVTNYNPTGTPTYDMTFNMWNTAVNQPGWNGVLYAGTVITFTMWMRQSNTLSVMYPYAQLGLNWWNDPPYHPTFVCNGWGTHALTTTMAAYTFTCTLSRTLTITPSDRLWVTPGVHITTFPSSKKSTVVYHEFEGSPTNGDSRVDIPMPEAIATTSTCPAANPADNLADDVALNACLATGGVVRLSPSGTGPGYIIDSGLQLTRNGTTFLSSSIDTRLVAGANLRAPMLTAPATVSNFSILRLTFDGNRGARTNRDDCADAATRMNGENLRLRGSNFTVEYVKSQNGLCGSSIDVVSPSFTLQKNQVTNNGFLAADGVPGGLSDGITAVPCDGGSIYDNTLTDNTDVDLRVGPHTANLGYCRAELNTITHTARHGFAGAMIAGGGDHNGSYLSSNTITSTFNNLELGILVGSHAIDPALATAHSGDVTNNTISGAVVPLAVDGVNTGTIDRNTVGGNQGYAGIGGCPFSAPFTAAHYGTAIVQAGAVARDFHPGSCSPCGNGVVEAGETCDLGIYNGAGTAACCTSACQLAAGAATCEPAGPGVGGLWAGQTLWPNRSITSASGRTTLIYQLDGNLVLYQTGGAPIWASNTMGTPGRVFFGGDGNLIIYDGSGAVVWQSNTAGFYGAKLVIQENADGIGDLVLYSGAGISPLWRASDYQFNPAVWGQNELEHAAWLAGADTPSGSGIVETELANGKAEIDAALVDGKPINIVLRGIYNSNAGKLDDPANAEAKTAVRAAVFDAQHIVVLGNDHDFMQANIPQWAEALTALALINYARNAGIHVRVITHSNGAASLGGMVEAADAHGLNQALGAVKKVVMFAPAATDVRLHHIFAAFTTWWNQNQTRVDVIYGIQDNALALDQFFLGPGPTGVNLATGMGGMIISGAIIGAHFGGILGAGIGAAIGFITGLFVESPAERAEEFLRNVEDNPWWFGGWVHPSFINQFSHNVVTYAQNSQTAWSLQQSQCVDGARECIPDCTLTVTPSYVVVPADGATITVDVSSPGACPWRQTAMCIDPLDPEASPYPCGDVTVSAGLGNGTATIMVGPSDTERAVSLGFESLYWNSHLASSAWVTAAQSP